MPLAAFGQVVENFESGNIDNWLQCSVGCWEADTTASISGEYSLHHIFDNSDAGIDQIGIPITKLHPQQGLTRWSFLIKHGYDPSSSNNWSVFLMSDAEPGSISHDGSTNGFALGVNLTGYDDTLRLTKVKGSVLSTVLNTTINWQADIGISKAVKIVVERAQEGTWVVSVYRLDGDLIGSGSGVDTEIFNPGWFGISYKYSSTRDRLLWIDDIEIEGNFYEDNEAPVVTGCEEYGKNAVEIIFNEPPVDEIMVPDNFSINAGEERSVYVKKMDALTYIIEFADVFINKSINTLIINKLCDKAGNCKENIQIRFTALWAETGDIIISEVMADPLPEVSLPGNEYLEILNRTEYAFNLKNWNLSTGGQNSLFPEFTIHPLEILIICQLQDTLLFEKYGSVKGLKQFPSLTDGGRIVCLYDSSGTLIHGVEYSAEWYRNELKSRGGWSLEMMDNEFPFFFEENWTASASRLGGTPGSVNSVACRNPDNSFYGVQDVFPDDSVNITVRFSEPVFCLPENIGGIKISGKSLVDLFPTDPLFREFIIKSESPLLPEEIYQLEIPDHIKDFAGNGIQKRSCDFGLPYPPGSGDIMFNELLFNPWPGDPDYIELYNSSGRVIDASRLQFVSVNDKVSDTSQIIPVSSQKRCILPGSFYAVTTDRQKISERYFSSDPDFLFETVALPSMSDDEGHLILHNRELDIIDEVRYNDEIHYSLLAGHEGVALEKTGPNNDSDNTANWHSATESSGWGTPGAPNSLYVDIPSSSDRVVFSSAKITPDSDGNEDNLIIHFSLTGNGNVVTVMVFDEAGGYVKNIAANIFVGPEASLIWDGTADDGSQVYSGIYIVLITLFDDTGKTDRWKKVCTVVRN